MYMALDATPVEPITMVIFGATGDLAKRKLIPALYHLACEEYLPRHFHIVGVARKKLSHEAFGVKLLDAIRSATNNDYQERAWARLSTTLSYVPLEFTNVSDYKALAKTLHAIDEQSGRCRPKMFYFAVAPKYYETIFENFQKSLLSTMCADPRSWTRVIVEKPFGQDLSSAMELNKKLSALFREDQIYRIDHYLGKETVQNILALRFANGIFEPTWNSEFIDHVQITVAESLGIEGRGEYYDKAGAMRDMVQNHLLQLLAHVGMDMPDSFDAQDVRAQRARVLRSIAPLDPQSVVRGQFKAGTIDGQKVEGYVGEPDVLPRSTTETAVAFKAFVNTPRWRTVPFYLRTGKRFPTRVSEITVQFNPPAQHLFGSGGTNEINILTMRIQPDEGVSVRLNVKKYGHGRQLTQVEMNFCYETLRKSNDLHEAYDTLLLAAMHGDQTLFAHIDEVEASWKLVTPVLAYWEKHPRKGMSSYAAGVWGPKDFDRLIAKDKRCWLTLALRVCDIHR